VPELARAEGSTRDEMISYWLAYYDSDNVPWNYRASTRVVKHSYRGLHALSSLLAACACEKTKQGRASNEEVIKLAAPISFGRSTQVFDLPRRQFPFGRDLFSGYRVPFFFVENGIVKLFYLQPRKNYSLSPDQLGMVATIHKSFLLDTEFFGSRTDIEYVDVSANDVSGVREVKHYTLDSLRLWPEKRLQERLSLVAESLDYVRTSGLVRPKKRVMRRPEPDMPLFD
jgi:hypothetical protein